MTGFTSHYKLLPPVVKALLTASGTPRFRGTYTIKGENILWKLRSLNLVLGSTCGVLLAKDRGGRAGYGWMADLWPGRVTSRPAVGCRAGYGRNEKFPEFR